MDTARSSKGAKVASKTKTIGVRMTVEQLKLIDQRAKRRGVPTSVWMRLITLQAAKSNATDGYIRIREPEGVTT